MDNTRKLQIGVSMPTWHYEDGRPARWEEMQEVARLVEDAGFDSLWVPDHLIREVTGGLTIGFWECWTVLAAVAAVTTRVTVGPFVACSGFHNPAHLAKSAETLDEVSGGRVILAVGAGVPERDRSWQAFGFPDDHPAGRFDEALQIISRLLKGERLTFEGQYYQARDCEILPTGPRPGSIPLWGAAKGPRTIRAAARWASALNLNVLCFSPETARQHFDLLDEACREVGRDPASMGRTGYTLVTFARPEAQTTHWRQAAIKGSAEEIAAQLYAIHQAGMEHISVYIDTEEGRGDMPYPPLTPRAVELFAPVLEILHKLKNESPRT